MFSKCSSHLALTQPRCAHMMKVQSAFTVSQPIQSLRYEDFLKGGTMSNLYVVT